MLEGTDHYAADKFFLFAASSIGRSIGSEAISDLTPMSVKFIDIVYKVPVDRREVRWVEKTLPKLLSEIEEFKRVVRRVIAPHCKPGLFRVSSFESSPRRLREAGKHAI